MNRIAGLGTVVLLGAFAPLMQASLSISYSTTGPAGATVCGTGASSGPVTCSTINGAGFTITGLSGSSNSPGTPTSAQKFGTTLQISTTALIPTLQIWLSAQGFTMPTNPPFVTYSSSLSYTATSGTGTVGLMGCADTSNTLVPPGAFCSTPPAGGTLTNTSLAFGPTPGSGANTVSDSIASGLTAPYSLEEVITLTNLSAGANFNVNDSEIITQVAVPEPASLLLMGTTLLGAGLVLRRRRGSKRS